MSDSTRREEADHADIKALRAQVADLRRQLRDVHNIHRQHVEKSGTTVCSVDLEVWPCRTAHAISGRGKGAA